MSSSGYKCDAEGQWWYTNNGKQYKAFERKCANCSKIEVVRTITKSSLCKSCALRGIPKSEEHKIKIGISYISKVINGKD